MRIRAMDGDTPIWESNELTPDNCAEEREEIEELDYSALEAVGGTLLEREVFEDYIIAFEDDRSCEVFDVMAYALRSPENCIRLLFVEAEGNYNNSAEGAVAAASNEQTDAYDGILCVASRPTKGEAVKAVLRVAMQELPWKLLDAVDTEALEKYPCDFHRVVNGTHYVLERWWSCNQTPVDSL